MKAVVVVALTILFLGSALLDKIYRVVPIVELRRRARGGKDPQTAKIYKMASYGSSLELLLWLVASLSAASLFLIAANIAWWLSLITILLAWLIWFSSPIRLPSGWLWSIAASLAPLLSSLLSLLQPVLSRVAGWFRKLWPPHLHTGIYEKEDLVELLDHQARQVDNRLSETELKIARSSLTFGAKSVGSVMTPRRTIKFVVVSDPVGPHLMDELHASGFSRFPVVKEISKSTEPQVVGILYLRDLLDYSQKGKVRDVMKHETYFINETQDLRQALGVFLKTHHHLLVVVNNFEEMVGVISLEDVLEQIVGEKIVDEFDRYGDLRSVAGLEAQKGQSPKDH